MPLRDFADHVAEAKKKKQAIESDLAQALQGQPDTATILRLVDESKARIQREV